MSSTFLEKIYDTQKNFILNDPKFKTPKSYYNKFSNIKYSKNLSPRFKIKFTNFYNEFIDTGNNNYNNKFYSPNNNHNKHYYNTITNFNSYNLNIKKNKPIDIFNYQLSLKNIINEKQKKINLIKNNFNNFSPSHKIKLNYKKQYLKDYLNIRNNFYFEQTENRINKMKKKKIYQPKKSINLNIKKNKNYDIFNKKIFGNEDNTFLNNDNRVYSVNSI